jgi:SNF2 family DNA or RNA helicase
MPNIIVERFGDTRIAVKPGSFLGDDAFPKYLAAVKSVGGTYSKTAKAHTLPLDIEVCRLLRSKFGKSLVIGPNLTAWAREAVKAEEALLATQHFDMTRPLDIPEVERIAPSMAAAMLARGYQTIVPEFGRHAGCFLNADQPGLGKTIETFGTMLEMGISGHVLVVAPKTSLEATWAYEVNKWLGEAGAVAYVVDGTAAKRHDILATALADRSPYVFVLVNAEMVRYKQIHTCNDPSCDGNAPEFCSATRKSTQREVKFPELFDNPWAAIIGDEIHRYLINANPRARSKSLVGMGFQRLPLLDATRGKFALSGTPMRGKPRLLWPTLHWLRPDLYPGQWAWSKRYFQTEPDEYAHSGERVTDNLRPEMEEAFNRELGRMMIRRTKDELRAINPEWAPPGKRYVEVWLPMSPAQKRAYTSMSRSATATLKGGSLDANGILAEMTRLRQFANSAGEMQDGYFTPTLPSNKVEWLLDTFLPERGITTPGDPLEAGNGKVVVVSQFTSFIGVIAEALSAKGIRYEVLTGITNRAGHFAAVQQDWQNNEKGARVLLLNTTAGGVSITLDRADEMVIFDETWVPDDQEQVEDRIHRTSRTDHETTFYYVRSEDSIERDLAGTNVLKDDRNRRSLDARRGVEVARKRFMQ